MRLSLHSEARPSVFPVNRYRCGCLPPYVNPNPRCPSTVEHHQWALTGLIAILVLALAFTVGYAFDDDYGDTIRVNEQAGDDVPDEGDEPDASGEYGILEEIEGILEEDFVVPEAVTEEGLEQGAIQGSSTRSAIPTPSISRPRTTRPASTSSAAPSKASAYTSTRTRQRARSPSSHRSATRPPSRRAFCPVT